MTIFIVKTGDEALRLDRSYLFGWKIDDADNQAANKIFGGIQFSYLRTAFADTNFFSEVHLQDVSGIPRFGERIGGNYFADPQLDFKKVIE